MKKKNISCMKGEWCFNSAWDLEHLPRGLDKASRCGILSSVLKRARRLRKVIYLIRRSHSHSSRPK